MRFLSIDHSDMTACKSSHAAHAPSKAVVVVLAFAAMLLACGCKTVSRDYPGVSHDQLWQAALGAARNPKYSDWFVTENGVFVDEAENRIEIYRELKRDYAPPGAALRRESETWTFSVHVDSEDRVPKVFLDTRTAIRTPNFLAEADHFFGEIDARLAQLPTDLNTSDSATTQTKASNKNGLEPPAALDAPAKVVVDPAPSATNEPGSQPPLTVP